MRILTPEQVRGLDERTIATLGLEGALLMETAGRAIARAIVDRVGRGDDRWVTVLAGTGNNGGDGFVAARVLAAQGFRVEVYGVGDPARMTPETQKHFKAMRAYGLDCRFFPQAPRPPELQGIRRSLGRSAAIVDALVGIGPTEDLRDPLATFAAQLDGRYRGLVVAADVPSGLCAVDGRILGVAVKAHLVVTMAAPKAGLFLGKGPETWDELEVADIGVPPAWIAAVRPCGERLDGARARELLPPRPDDGHKGKFGHVFVVAGSPGKGGAALLCSGAAMRSGVGLCTVGTSGEIRGRLEGDWPDAMVEAIRGGAGEAKRIEKLLHRKTAIVAGPGLGTGAAEVDLVGRLMSMSEVPVLLDADALTALAAKPELAQPAAGRLVLTPHPGEMAALLNSTIEAVEADRPAAARTVAERFQAVVVLKGSRTFVAAPDGDWAIWPRPNAALAKGGSGDVLAGIIGALLAQGLPCFHAAQLGVTVHALAGERLRAEFGERAGLASDLIQQLPAVWRSLENPAVEGVEGGPNRSLAPRSGER